jgi:hypothetical protein
LVLSARDFYKPLRNQASAAYVKNRNDPAKTTELGSEAGHGLRSPCKAFVHWALDR